MIFKYFFVELEKELNFKEGLNIKFCKFVDKK